MPDSVSSGLPEYVAHTPAKAAPGRWHTFADHTGGVAERAARFAAEAFGEAFAPLGSYLGYRHDLGKLSDDFQNYLHACFLADHGKARRPQRGKVPHKQAGAVAALEDDPRGFGPLLAILIQGHHGGMLSLQETPRKAAEKASAAQVRLLRERARAAFGAAFDPAAPDTGALLAPFHARPREDMEMFLRLLFSCLVDADGLDTEAHHDPEAAAHRARLHAALPTLSALRDRLDQRQQTDFADADSSTPVNRVRKEVYDACREAAVSLPPGVFTLTVPTGGGKTRSSLAFALHHAAKYDLRRVIYAIPYTSIVDQTATVFRDVLGEGAILEHHSAIDALRFTGEDEKQAQRLAAQNWEGAPVVVTTTVQLFESLFANRPSACRKLHRLARSVIVLDEVQTLPAPLLTPLLSGLRALVENTGATVVLCTATQPAVTGDTPYLKGLPNVQHIIADPKPHFEALRRVRYRVEADSWEWARVADEMRRSSSSLCVVNTRKQALALLEALDPEYADDTVLHLSTLLCGRHRQEVLAEIRRRLDTGQPVHVASTQVVEAGVDIDMPFVLRAVGPLDRIIQAAGRCNREGRRPRDESEVVVFTPADGAAPQGVYLTALDRTKKLLAGARATGEPLDFDDPNIATDYFADLYATLGASELDFYGVQKARAFYNYPDVAKHMRLIPDETVSVLITDYPGGEAEAQAIIAEAQARGGMTRDLWQRAQPLCVSLRSRDAEADKGAPVEEIVPGAGVGLFIWRGVYHAKKGIPLSHDTADPAPYRSDFLIA